MSADKACRSFFFGLLGPLQVTFPHPKCENFNILSQISHSLLEGFFSNLTDMY